MELTEPGLRVKNAEKTQQSKRASGEEIRPAVSVGKQGEPRKYL